MPETEAKDVLSRGGAAFNAVREAILGSSMKPEGKFLLDEITKQDIEITDLRAQLRTAEEALNTLRHDVEVATMAMPVTEATTHEDRIDWLCRQIATAEEAREKAEREYQQMWVDALRERDEARLELAVQIRHRQQAENNIETATGLVREARAEVQGLTEAARNAIAGIPGADGLGPYEDSTGSFNALKAWHGITEWLKTMLAGSRAEVQRLQQAAKYEADVATQAVAEVQRLSGQMEEMRHRIRKARQILSTAPYTPEAIDAAMGAPGEGQSQMGRVK